MITVRGRDRSEKTRRTKRRNPFSELTRLVSAMRSASPSDEKPRTATLVAFLGALTAADLDRIVTVWRKLLRRDQGDLHATLVDVRPASDPLLVAFIRADERWADGLPDPPQMGPPPRSADDWYVILRRDGLPETQAREHAAALSQSPKEVERDFLLSAGLTPAQVDAEAARRRRNEKFTVANTVIDSIALAVRDRLQEDALRKECATIAAHAVNAAKDIAGLIARPEDAAKVRDGRSNSLANAIDRAIVAGNPRAPRVDGFSLVTRTALRSPRGLNLHDWSDVAFSAQDLANDIAEGRQPDDAQIAQMARDVTAIGAKARAAAAQLHRHKGRPAKLALDAAEALKAYGCTYQQIAELLRLDRRDLHLTPHTPEIIRKSLLARKRSTPARK
jgi:hypothetical protein